MLTQIQINEIKTQLEAITAQYFETKIAQNDHNNLLLEYTNHTQIAYMLSLRRLNYKTFQLDLAIRKYKEIETNFSKILDNTQLTRFLNNLRWLCAIWLKQASFHDVQID